MRVSSFHADVLRLDVSAEIARIVAALRRQVGQTLRRKGVVLGLSGGIDSSVCAALCVRAFGRERVLGLMMPEHDSASDSLALGQLLADHLGIPAVEENIGPILEAAGCYRRRDAAIQSVVPEYGPGYRSKIVLPSLDDHATYRVFSVVVQDPAGQQSRTRLPLEAYQTIVAATNFKQRTRKMVEYFHADRLRYAVVGTPNRLEYDLGFFVKNGDGSADVKPIAHLYKSQVYQLAEALDLPDVIRTRPPTTDTYSLEQSQEEFYFAVSLRDLDYCLYARNQEIAAADVAPVLGRTADFVARVYGDIDAKRKASEYLHAPPLLVEPVREAR